MARMRVTTVRISEDLWDLLAREAQLGGVSVSQYVREAALARAVASAAVRGEEPFELLAGGIRELADSADPEQARAARRALAQLSRSLARSTRRDASALVAEADQAQRRAAESRDTRAERARRD
jgi:hypothetical protein